MRIGLFVCLFLLSLAIVVGVGLLCLVGVILLGNVGDIGNIVEKKQYQR